MQFNPYGSHPLVGAGTDCARLNRRRLLHSFHGKREHLQRQSDENEAGENACGNVRHRLLVKPSAADRATSQVGLRKAACDPWGGIWLACTESNETIKTSYSAHCPQARVHRIDRLSGRPQRSLPIMKAMPGSRRHRAHELVQACLQ